MNPSQAASDAFGLPKPVGQLISHLPAYPGSLLLVAALNRVLESKLPVDVLNYLLHKRLRIQVRDAGMCFDFSCTGTRFVARARQNETDLTICANAYDFFRLAQRQEDPDTLFFNRRLSMEGDTELGLVVKNALDALEVPILDLRQLSLQSVLARFASGPSRRASSPRPWDQK